MKSTHFEVIPPQNTSQVSDQIRTKLIAHNVSVSDIKDEERVVLAATNNDEDLIGGVSATLWGGCLEIDYIWVSEELRGSGVGSELLKRLEKLVKERGCRRVILDTFSFQAPEFYAKQGYQEYQTIEGYSDGTVAKHFFKKDLD